MKRDRTTPASRSPLIDLEAELRALDRKRREALGEAERGRRDVRITPGAWGELELAVDLKRAA